MARRVLCVTPLWPPLGNVGVRRVVRLARHLPACGWQPVILTDDPPGSGYPWPKPHDPSAEAPACERYTASGWLPFAAARRALIAAARLGPPRAPYQAHRLTAKLALPDHYPEWTLAAVRAARKIPNLDAVWTTGGPFGMFAVAVAVAKALGLPCVLDYRDPWSVDIGPDRVPRWPKAAHQALEGWLLGQADGVAYVNADMRARNAAAFPKAPRSNWAVIPNGFDAAEHAAVPAARFERPTVLYTGGFYGQRSAAPAVEALARLGAEAPDLALYGEVDPAGRAAIEAAPEAPVTVCARVSAAEISGLQRGAAALLLAVGPEHRTALTGKIFDYLCAGRPILGYGPADADAGRLIEAAGVGVWIPQDDQAGLSAALRQAALGQLPYTPRPEVIHPYSAARMAERTAALLDAARAAYRSAP